MLHSNDIWKIIKQHMPRDRWLKLWDIYEIVERHVDFDDDDLKPVIRGYKGQNPQLVWGRNVRNVLQSKKPVEIEWDGDGSYLLRGETNGEDQLPPVPVESTDWVSDVASCIETLDTKFSLADVYSFETQLSSMHPESGSIRPSIRQTLQKLRDRGAINFVDNAGNYAKSNDFPAGIQIIDISSEDSQDPFEDDSDIPDDPDEKYLRSIRKRRGAPRFRRGLLRLYGQRCAITGEGPVDVLEAAHIEPHAVRGRNSADNGLLLRADIHTLFDLGLLKVEPNSMSVQIHPKLRSTYYESLHGTILRPRSDGSAPNLAYLQEKYDQPPRLRL
jgi:hypothetical protein